MLIQHPRAISSMITDFQSSSSFVHILKVQKSMSFFIDNRNPLMLSPEHSMPSGCAGNVVNTAVLPTVPYTALSASGCSIEFRMKPWS